MQEYGVNIRFIRACIAHAYVSHTCLRDQSKTEFILHKFNVVVQCGTVDKHCVKNKII